jgi:hypothetical protein
MQVMTDFLKRATAIQLSIGTLLNIPDEYIHLGFDDQNEQAASAIFTLTFLRDIDLSILHEHYKGEAEGYDNMLSSLYAQHGGCGRFPSNKDSISFAMAWSSSLSKALYTMDQEIGDECDHIIFNGFPSQCEQDEATLICFEWEEDDIPLIEKIVKGVCEKYQIPNFALRVAPDESLVISISLFSPDAVIGMAEKLKETLKPYFHDEDFDVGFHTFHETPELPTLHRLCIKGQFIDPSHNELDLQRLLKTYSESFIEVVEREDDGTISVLQLNPMLCLPPRRKPKE